MRKSLVSWNKTQILKRNEADNLGEEIRIPIVELYGKDAIDLATELIKELESGSNIPFDIKYMKLGTSFLNLKADEIIQGKKKHCDLKSLISESFGEAAMYKYHVMHGEL